MPFDEPIALATARRSLHERHAADAALSAPLRSELRARFPDELPSLEHLMCEQGIDGPQGRELWESYEPGTPEEEDAFYRVIVEECW
jgi:hypothetical protein